MPRIDFEYDPSVIAKDTAQVFLDLFAGEAASVLEAEIDQVVAYGRQIELKSGLVAAELGVLYNASKIARLVEEEWRYVPTINYEFDGMQRPRSEEHRRYIAEHDIRTDIKCGLAHGAIKSAQSCGIPEGTAIVLTATPTNWDIVDDIWNLPVEEAKIRMVHPRI